MRHEPEETRAELVEQFKTLAKGAFESGKYRSMMLAFAQYWNDNADDECHQRMFWSVRDVPLFSRECEWYPEHADDACQLCDSTSYPDYSFYGVGKYVDAIAPFCHEHASQSDRH